MAVQITGVSGAGGKGGGGGGAVGGGGIGGPGGGAPGAGRRPPAPRKPPAPGGGPPVGDRGPMRSDKHAVTIPGQGTFHGNPKQREMYVTRYHDTQRQLAIKSGRIVRAPGYSLPPEIEYSLRIQEKLFG